MKNINLGNKNGLWLGDKVGYKSLHQWLRNHKKKSKLCEKCKKVPPYDLANINGKYNRDVSNYQWLCRKCHMKFDKEVFNLRVTTKGWRGDSYAHHLVAKGNYTKGLKIIKTFDGEILNVLKKAQRKLTTNQIRLKLKFSWSATNKWLKILKNKKFVKKEMANSRVYWRYNHA